MLSVEMHFKYKDTNQFWLKVNGEKDIPLK
jgi:hypothetical protein